MEIRPLREDDDRDVAAAFGIESAALRHDVPDFPPLSLTEYVARIRHPWPGESQHLRLAELDGTPAGLLWLFLPELENLSKVLVELVVHPEHRRQGVGRALHAYAAEFARSRGRTSLIGTYVSHLPGGPWRDPGHARFAATVGAKPALSEVRRVLDLTTVDKSGWPQLAASVGPHAAGYSLVRWRDRIPDEYLADIAALDSRLILDAPMGDLDVEPELIDAARARDRDEVALRRGRRHYHVAARHDQTGRLVAWTTIALDPEATRHAWQNITLVDPEHRGNRLGLLVKLDNLAQVLAAEPELREINTWNAAENQHMIAINEALGFRPVDGWIDWQQEA
ncbi:MAG: GNAT family N-acetyltransferase [Micromonosporaceae bacterium]